MLDDALPKTGGPKISGRAGRAQLLAFVTDAETESVLRQGLAAAAPEEIVVHRGDCRTAIVAMGKTQTPLVLVVDISGVDQPMSALIALSEVVEPDVRVLVVGDKQDVNLYRQLTRSLGVAEYLYKPLSAEVVAQHFAPFIASAGVAAAQTQGGRFIAVTGLGGGAGATTIAANLAWYLATDAKRHTVLLDANLHTGNAALLLGAKTGGGLRLALETPEQVDELFMERIAQPATERLSVIAAEEKLSERPSVADGACHRLLLGLRQRYNYVIADVPAIPLPWYCDLLDQARQRILVIEPTLLGIRDALRVMEMPIGSQQTRKPLVVVNKLGVPGTMTGSQLETAMGQKIGVVFPYLPRLVNLAATMGQPAVGTRGSFRLAIQDLAREVAASGATYKAPTLLTRLFGRGKAA